LFLLLRPDENGCGCAIDMIATGSIAFSASPCYRLCEGATMDPDRFLRELPSLFEDFPRSELPLDPRFGAVLDRVDGLAKPNNLALLNLAASLVEPGESYVEVGAFRGTSLIAALLGNEDKDVVAIDDFSKFEGSWEQLDGNLREAGLGGVATILEGDVFEIVPAGALGDRRVGVWYYDAAHDHDSQLTGLRIVEPWLAPDALLIVDDTDWESVSRAIDDYLATQPRARRILKLDGEDFGAPRWWYGMQVLAWGG
jgi:predicted O-methyltransferase YrrM